MPDERPLHWDHVFLLGWYDETGKAYLSSWMGNAPMVHVVVTGVNSTRFPLWKAPIPPNAQLHPMPKDLTPYEFVSHATSMNGYYAFGFYMEDVIDRAPKEPRAVSV